MMAFTWAGAYSIGIWFRSLNNVTEGFGNIAIGWDTLMNTEWDNNIGMGNSALAFSTTWSDNVAVGHLALYANGTWMSNVAIGSYALQVSEWASYNTAVWNYAMYSSTSWSRNVAVGSGAGYNITTWSDNIAIGNSAFVPSATSSNQLNIGNWIYGTGGNIGIGQSGAINDKLVVVGTWSFQGLKILSGASNGYILTSDASGNARWAAAGGSVDWSLSGNTIGVNDFIGSTNDINLVFKRNNIMVWYFSTGGNMALWESALKNNTSGTNNIAIGSGSLKSNTTWNSNTIVGVNSLWLITWSKGNTAIGADSMSSTGIWDYNVSVWQSSLRSWQRNVSLWMASLYFGSWTHNIGIGFWAGADYDNIPAVMFWNFTILSTGPVDALTWSNNIFLWANTRYLYPWISNSIAIGEWITLSESNTVVLWNNANVGIWTTSPISKLDVVGTGTFQGLKILSGASNGYVLTSDASGNARWAAAGGSTVPTGRSHEMLSEWMTSSEVRMHKHLNLKTNNTTRLQILSSVTSEDNARNISNLVISSSTVYVFDSEIRVLQIIR
jgi:hypothetical protein